MMNDNQKIITQNAVVFFLYLATYISYTFPLIMNFESSFLGKGDANIHLFNLINFSNSKDLFFTEFLFYPIGQSTIFHTSDLALSFFSSLFNSSILGMNIYLLLTYGFSGLGAYIFSKRYLQNNIYSFICGFVFAFSSYKTTRLLGHYNLVLTAAIPFLMLLFLQLYHKEYQTIRQRNYKFSLFLCLFLFSTLNDYVVTICFLYFTLFYFSFFPIKRFLGQLNWKSSKTILVLASTALLLHFIIQALVRMGVDHNGGIFYGGDLLGFIFPYNHYFINFPSLEKIFMQAVYPIDGVTFVGYILLFLFVFSAFLRQKKLNQNTNISVLVFVLVCLFFIIMPQVRFLGKNLFYSPFALHHFVPFINQMRAPIRVFYVFIFILSIITFYKLLNSKYSNFFNRKAVSLIIVTLMFLEYYPSKYPINNINETEEIYFKLKEKPGESVLILPFGINDGLRAIGVFEMKQLANIYIHQKKIYGGHMSRINDAQFTFVKENDFLNTLCALETDEMVNEIDYQNCKKSFRLLKMDYLIIPENYQKEKVIDYVKTIIDDRLLKEEMFNGGILITLKPNL